MTDDNHSMCHFYCNFSVFPHIITVSPDITDIFASQIQTYGRHIKTTAGISHGLRPQIMSLQFYATIICKAPRYYSATGFL